MEEKAALKKSEDTTKLNIGRDDKIVYMKFGQPILGMEMTSNQAITIGNLLIRHGRKLVKEKNKKKE